MSPKKWVGSYFWFFIMGQSLEFVPMFKKVLSAHQQYANNRKNVENEKNQNFLKTAYGNSQT